MKWTKKALAAAPDAFQTAWTNIVHGTAPPGMAPLGLISAALGCPVAVSDADSRGVVLDWLLEQGYVEP